MNINPIELLKNFKNIQSRVMEIQEKLKDIKITGSAGGDMVQIDMDCNMMVKGVRISKEIVNPNDIEMLQDLVMSAITDTIAKVKEKMKDETSAITGGINIPPGFMGL